MGVREGAFIAARIAPSTAAFPFHDPPNVAVTDAAGVSSARLQQLLMPYRDGCCPVLLHYRNSQASVQLKLGEDWKVTLHDDLLNSLNGELGQQNIRITY